MSSRGPCHADNGRDIGYDAKLRRERTGKDDDETDISFSDEDIESQIEKLITYIKNLLKEIKKKEALCKEAIVEKDKIRTELQQCLEDKKQLQQKLLLRKTDESKLQQLQEKIEKTKTENDRLAKKNELLVKENDRLATEIANIKRESRKTESEATLRDKLDAKNKLIQKLNTECEELKTRLSRMMGQKLLDGNPDITDLSDKNRPTKLGERYAELYDNQWTDAFEIVEIEVNASSDEEREKECVRILLKILMSSQKFCDDEAKKQDDEIKRAFYRTGKSQNHNSFTKDMTKQLKDIKKAVAPEAVDVLYKEFLRQTRKDTIRERMTHRLTEYVKECVSICWLMTVQDPPVVFGPNVGYGDPFNKSHYREYTCSGTKIDFVVWPPLLLHEGGPVLTKGVAQGLKQKTHEDTTRDRTISATSKKSSPAFSSRKTNTDSEVDDFFRSETRYGQSSKRYDLIVDNAYDKDAELFVTNYDGDFKGSMRTHERDSYDRNHRRSRSQPEDGKKRTTADVISRWRQNHSSTALYDEYDRKKMYTHKRYIPKGSEYELYLGYVKRFGHETAKVALGDEVYDACVAEECGYSYA